MLQGDEVDVAGESFSPCPQQLQPLSRRWKGPAIFVIAFILLEILLVWAYWPLFIRHQTFKSRWFAALLGQLVMAAWSFGVLLTTTPRVPPAYFQDSVVVELMRQAIAREMQTLTLNEVDGLAESTPHFAGDPAPNSAAVEMEERMPLPVAGEQQALQVDVPSPSEPAEELPSEEVTRRRLDEIRANPTAMARACREATRLLDSPDTDESNEFRRYLLQGAGHCSECRVYQLMATHHCKWCGTCVVERDTHCVCIGQCVGWGNRKLFVLTVMYASLASVTHWVLLTPLSGDMAGIGHFFMYVGLLQIGAMLLCLGLLMLKMIAYGSTIRIYFQREEQQERQQLRARENGALYTLTSPTDEFYDLTEPKSINMASIRRTFGYSFDILLAPVPVVPAQLSAEEEKHAFLRNLDATLLQQLAKIALTLNTAASHRCG